MNFDPSILIQYGGIGIVLLWFMFRMERKLDNHTAVINDLVRTISMDIMARDNISDAIKFQARDILSRANVRAAKAHVAEPSEA